MLNDFKKFAMKGNIIDMAIGVIIGGAFQKIVTSLVNDIIMPTVSIFTGKVDFTNLCITVGGSKIKYGNFITTIVDFLIIAFSIFIALKVIKHLDAQTRENLEKITKKKTNKKEELPETKVCEFCYSKINYKATRCPFCTSEVTKSPSKS